jgi:hypothetical protein
VETDCGLLLLQLSMDVQEFSLGTAPPMFGLQGAYWSMEGQQVAYCNCSWCVALRWVRVHAVGVVYALFMFFAIVHLVGSLALDWDLGSGSYTHCFWWFGRRC